jgi:hypothetical protein
LGENLRRRLRNTPEINELIEKFFKTDGRDDFPDPGRRITCIPKRVPLIARFEDKIARLSDDHAITKQRADASFQN